MTGFSQLAWVTIAGAAASAMILSLLGSMPRALAERLKLSGEQTAGLPWVLTIVLVPATILAGLLVDSLGALPILSAGAVVSSSALLVLTSGGGHRRCVGAAALAGVGAVALNCGSIVLLTRVCFDGNAVAAANLGFVFIGLAALLTPLLADRLLTVQKTGYRRTLGLFAALAVVPLFLALAASPHPALSPSGRGWGEGAAWSTAADTLRPSVFLRPTIWLAGAVFVFYAPLEGWLSAAAFPHLRGTDFSERRAAGLVGLSWIVFLAARLLIAYWEQTGALDPASVHVLLLGLAVIAVIAVGNLLAAVRRNSIAVCLLLMAVCLGPILPSLVAFVFLSTDPSEHGAAYGMLFALGTMGSLLGSRYYMPRPGKAPTDRTPLRVLTGIGLALIGAILATWLTR